jgi:RHS repeat-associated protein
MSGVDFDDDRFALDGQRLICVSGTYGANGAEYRTETDAMAKIVSYTCDTTCGPAWFKVWLPNGNIAYYGNTQDSRIGLQQHHDVCLWLLNRVEDRNGNYMEYYYVRGGANYWLDRVRYGGNTEANIPYCYTLKCHYSKRDDKEVSFIGDNTLDQKYRLDSIRVMRGDNVLHKYGFEYHAPNLSNGYYYTRLNQINFSCGGESYNPTVVQWATNDYGSYGSAQCHSISVTGGSASDFNGKIKFTGDLNGDGYTDVIVYEPNLNGHKAAVIYLNKGLSSSGSVCFSKLSSTISLESDIDWIHTPDINGDGLDDILLVNFDKHFFGSDELSLSAYLSSVGQDGSYIFTSVQQGFGEFPIKRRYKDRVLIGDFLGEGRQSILLQEAVDGPDVSRMVYVTYSNGMLLSTQLPQDMTLDADRLFTSDFNGDGISEIYFMNRNTPSTGLLRMRRSGSTYSYETVNSNMLSAWHQVFPGDFNGDGKPDLLSYVEDSDHNPYWSLNYFKESSLKWPTIHFSEETLDIGSPETHSYSLTDFDNPDYKFITVGDFNGDGKADVAFRSAANYMKFLYSPVHEENDKWVFASTQTVSLDDIGMTGVSNQTICTGNFLGRENLSVFSASTVYSLNPVSNRYAVTAVTDGMGNRTAFEYDYLMPKPTGATDSDFYTRSPQTSDEQASHMFTISLPMKGMKKMTCLNTLSESPVTEVRYRYSNALVHKQGRGFLGFKSTTTENWIASEKRQTVERHSETLFTVPCLALRTENVKIRNGSTVSTTENENRMLVKRNPSSGVMSKTFVPVVWKQTSLNYDLNNPQLLLSKTITQSEYNDTVVHVLHGTVVLNIHAYDLLKQTTVHQGVDSCASVTSASQCEFQTITQTSYVNESQSDIQNWVVNRPYSVLTTVRRLGGYSDVKSLAVSRYTSTGNPFLTTVVESYPGGVESSQDSLATIEDRVYSATGSLTLRSVGDVMGRLPVRRWSYDYSGDGRFLVREVNPAGDTTSYSYNQNYCYVTSETDPNGLVTTHTRTPLGCSFTTTYPDGRVTHGETMAGVADEYIPSDTYYIEWSTTTGSGMNKAYYNAAGQKLRTLTEGMDGEAILKDYVYNDKGLLAGESLPYFYGDEPAGWNYYRYDDYGRHIITEHPDEMAEVTSYQGFTTWHVRYLDDPDDPPSTATTVNAAGWVVKSVDEERNEVRYDHYADGKLKTTQLGNDSGTAVSVGYDAAGNRTTLTDPNYGTVKSVYDAYGQLTLTVSPKGDTTTYQYDILARMVKRYERNHSNNSVDSTSWLYSNHPGTRGLLTNLDYNGKEQTFWYIYDNLCRVTTVAEMRKSEYYFTNYNYDNASRVSSITYPTGFTLKREYTATGHLQYISDQNNNLLWETLGKNAMGQITRCQTGDGITTERRYDPLTGRLIGVLSYNLTDTIQNLSYVYDKNANLASRMDRIRLMEERFTYDLLDRLTGVVEGLDTTGVFAYDAYGRMTSKYLHGEMVFDSTAYWASGRPHALKTARMYSYQPDMETRYTSFDKLQRIQMGNTSLSYQYGYEHQRLRMDEMVGNDTVRTKVYAGNWMYYVHPDHLGSWTTLTAWNGNVVQDVWFDPWGTAHNITPGGEPSPVFSLLFDRGFTGHEHMMLFGLINMNGRVYDPVTSSFLSVDNYVQDPSYTQNFNRYTYCLNNPLKYTDPDGELFWIIPNISWSIEGGLNFGLTFAVGLPGLWSAQASLGYSVGSQSVYGSAGVTFAGVTGYVSAGYSFKNEQVSASVGVTAGLSPYCGVPVSTNFLTVGASCDYSYSKTAGSNFSFSGQLSVCYYNSSAKGWNYNLSISAMVFPEHTTNLFRGQGFRSNNKVLQRFVANNQYQQALDYFGFEGEYRPNKAKGAEYVEGEDYFGSTHPTTGDISFGNLAFDSYDILRGTYEKEKFTRTRVLNGTPLETTDLENIKYFPEEALGFRHAFYYNGLYPYTSIDCLGQANAYWMSVYGSEIRSPRYYDFIFKIPRKW